MEGKPCWCRVGVAWVISSVQASEKDVRFLPPSPGLNFAICPPRAGCRAHSPAWAQDRRGLLPRFPRGWVPPPQCPRPCLGVGCPRPAARARPGRGRDSTRRVQPPGSAPPRLRPPVTSCPAQRRPCRAAATTAAACKLWWRWRTRRAARRRRRRRRGSPRAGGGRCERGRRAGAARFRAPGSPPLTPPGLQPPARPAPFPWGYPTRVERGVGGLCCQWVFPGETPSPYFRAFAGAQGAPPCPRVQTPGARASGVPGAASGEAVPLRAVYPESTLVVFWVFTHLRLFLSPSWGFTPQPVLCIRRGCEPPTSRWTRSLFFSG